MPYKDTEEYRAYQRAYRSRPEFKEARRQHDREQYGSDPEFRARQNAATYAWSRRNRDKANELQRNYGRKVKHLAMDHYGGVCACCSETEPAFLSIDHIDNNGAELRKSGEAGHPRQGGTALYAWLRRNDYPPGFQVLCFNCNRGKEINGGVCPHQMRGG